MNSAVHRRLSKQLALLQRPVSMHEYSGDPNYLGQKVNSASQRQPLCTPLRLALSSAQLSAKHGGAAAARRSRGTDVQLQLVEVLTLHRTLDGRQLLHDRFGRRRLHREL
jgi:hypothetical protein